MRAYKDLYALFLFMRVKGEITINFISPITTDIVGVYFTCEGRNYTWNTTTWKRGDNPIPYSISGDKYKVSFTVCEDDRHVKNLRILK